MLSEDYWSLVENDPRDWNHNQKVLFWWVVDLLGKVTPKGVIAAPSPAPLTDAEISDVFREILPENDERREFMGKSWKYQDQLVTMPSADGNLVTINDGEIEVVNGR